MSYTVSAADLKTLRINEADAVASVLQNVAVILSTGQRTSPMYRDFGLPQDFVDRPTPAAKVLLYASVKEAIEAYEPRAEVINVTFAEDPAVPGRLIPKVEVNINE